MQYTEHGENRRLRNVHAFTEFTDRIEAVKTSELNICLTIILAYNSETDMGWVHPWVGLGRIFQHM